MKDNSNEANKIESAQATLLEIQANVERELARARYALIEAADENRRLRQEALRVNLVIYTEKEAADVLKVSEGTLRRKRTSLNLPHMRVGSMVRYSNLHLIEIVELLSRREESRQAKARKRA
jgi:uncharacterized protein YigA (DUF484 family)